MQPEAAEVPKDGVDVCLLHAGRFGSKSWLRGAAEPRRVIYGED